MIQRVKHIDNLMTDSARIYLDLSFRRFFYKNLKFEGNATIYQLNVFIHFFLIAQLLKSARLVYVHSAYNALKVIAFKTQAHIIFDAHGIVPEELNQEGRRLAARIFCFVELIVLRRCDTLIFVTESMRNHFHTKYGARLNVKEIILPILPSVGDYNEALQALNAKRNLNSVIYAGGMQAWQNVDKMLDAAQRRGDMSYTFLTGDTKPFVEKLKDCFIPSYYCHSVAPENVKEFYLTHEYGFVLRDEILVNLVACPTKLVEYLYWGVLPIIITPRIGDFNANSLHGVTLDRFISGDLPDTPTKMAMRQNNQRTVLEIFASAKNNQEKLQHLLMNRSQDREVRNLRV
jgi:hypothetical protein